ncbi:MAG: type II toxin-antitoxin system RelE/ParE family toxin [Candidatus Firestonebacteria bacterium]
MVRKINWTIRALNDLQDIYGFIAKDSKRYAQIQIENIQNAVLNLISFPLMGHNLPEFSHLPYREILVDNYRIIYRLEKDIVIIMLVVHGRRLIKKILK